MLPRERVRVALEGGRPDRVPILLECDFDYMARAAGCEPWEWVHADSLEQAQIHERHLLRHCPDLWPCWAGPSRAHLAQRQILRTPEGPIYLDTRTGRRYRIGWWGDLLDAPESLGTGTSGLGAEPQDQGSRRSSQWLASSGHPRAVESEADIAELLGPAPPPQYWVESGFLSNLAYLLPRHGQTYFLAFPLNTIFAEVLDLFGGFEEGLVALHTKRQLVHRALAQVVEWKKSRLRAGAGLGAPGAWMTEYMAGVDIISPATYREFVFPYEQEVAREAHRLGLKVYLWYLGHVMPLAPDIARLEIDGLFPEQGRKGYAVDVVDLRREVGDHMCLFGFNLERDLIEGRREALTAEIRRQIGGAGRDGAFIMGTTIITGEVAPEHVDAYVGIVRREGGVVGAGLRDIRRAPRTCGVQVRGSGGDT